MGNDKDNNEARKKRGLKKMHYRLFVTLNKKGLPTSSLAKMEVMKRLNEQGFCGESSHLARLKTGRKLRYGSYYPEDETYYGEADWFVIGGRWSGELTKTRLKKKKIAQFRAEFKDWFTDQKNGEKERAEQEKALLPKYFSEKELPMNLRPLFWRDTYSYKGHFDDCQLIDKKMFSLIKKYKKCDGRDKYGSLYFTDLDGDKPSPKFIGNKYLVIVDYHN